MVMEFDHIIGNPPYLGKEKLYFKIFNKMYSKLNDNGTLYFIHPAMPYFNKNQKTLGNKDVKTFINIVNNNESWVHFINVGTFGEVFITNDLVLTKVIKKEGDVRVRYEDGREFTTTVEYINKMKLSPDIYKKCRDYFEKLVTNNGSLQSIIKKGKNIEKLGVHFQLSLVRGNIDKERGGVKDDFYSFFSKQKYQGTLDQKNINVGIPCNYNQIDNIRSYLETKFARFGFSLLKFDFNMGKSYYRLIPIVDFNEYWTDDKLFEYFQVPEDVQEAILGLPDYSSLRDKNEV
jgi:hypothetical protein